MKNILFIILILLSLQVKSQDNPHDIAKYNFIRYNDNNLIFTGDSLNHELLFSKMDTLILKGIGQIKILQIGASHTQADFFSGRVRQQLLTMNHGLNAGRGFVFPYKLSKTNNPWNYYTKSTGEWQTCRNVEWKKFNTLGITGISAITRDSTASVSFTFRTENYMKFETTRIKILHDTSQSNYSVELSELNVKYTLTRFDSLGYSEIILDEPINNFSFRVRKTDSIQNKFEFYGLELETDYPGIIYSSIGINGASLQSYLRCQLFKEQLKILSPNMIVIFLGINDANTKHFNADLYESNYDTLLSWIKQVLPNTAVTLIVPNDCYLFRKRPNPNIAQTETVIYRLGKKHNCAIWDMYKIMGGLNSSVLWYKEGFMARDKIHFSAQGYLFLGDLFYSAFMKSYENHIAKKIKKNINYNR